MCVTRTVTRTQILSRTSNHPRKNTTTNLDGPTAPRSDGYRSASSDLMANIRDYRLAYMSVVDRRFMGEEGGRKGGGKGKRREEEAQRVMSSVNLNFEHERRKEQEHESAGSNPAKCRSESPRPKDLEPKA